MIDSMDYLFFLGTRNYVKSSSQLRYLCDYIMDMYSLSNYKDIFIQRYKQIAPLAGPLEIVSIEKEIEASSVRATASLIIQGSEAEFLLRANTGNLPRKTDESYRQENFLIKKNQAETHLEAPSNLWSVLEEVVELTKRFHIERYNAGEKTYKFWVGGFNSLALFSPEKEQSLTLTCEISRPFMRSNILYSNPRVRIIGKMMDQTFSLPFVGQEVSR